MFVAGIRGGPWRGQLYVSKYSLNLRSFGYRTHLDEPFVSRSMEPITITLDFLKSSSRGGPRVPRPLLLVKVTAAAAARAAPLFSRPKSTRSRESSFATFEKSHTNPTPSDPPFSFAQDDSSTTHARRMAPSIRRRALHLPCSGSPALLARRARRAPRPLAHNVFTYPHVRTERCCPVLHCSPFRFVICAAYLRFLGPRAIPYLELCRLADADQLESGR